MDSPGGSDGFGRAELEQLIEVNERLASVDDPTALLSGLFAFAPVGFQVYRADGHCILTNAEFRRIFGSEPPPDYNVLHDELAEQAGVLGLIHRAFAGEVVKVPTVWYDPRELRQVQVEHGNRVAIQATFFPLLDREGRVGHVALAFKDMTAEVTAREAVEAERLRLATVLEQLPTGVVIAEAPSGKLLEGNAQVERIWRHPFLTSMAEYRGFHSDGRPYREDEWPVARAIRTGEVVQGEIVQIERGDASRGTLRVSAAPIRNPDGAISGGVVVFDDVTEQRRAEQSAEEAGRELRASRDLLAGVLRGVSDAVTAQAVDGRLLFANEAAATLLGYSSPDELLSESSQNVAEAWEMLDESGQPFPFQQLPGRRALRGESAPDALVRYRPRGGGEDRWSLVRAQVVRDASGEPVASITLTQDVTARRRAEERLRFLAEAGARLPASLEVSDTLAAVASVAVETLADWCAVYLVDDEGRLAQSLVQHRDPAKVQQAREFQQRYPPQHSTQSLIWQVLHTGTPVLLPEITDETLQQAARDPELLRLIRELGLTSAIWVPLRAANHSLGVLGLFTAESRRRMGRDDLAMAEEVAARASLAIANAVLFASERVARSQAEAAVRARDEFLGIASHELRNPLASLSGTAQLIQRASERGTLDDARLRDYIGRLLRSAAHLSLLTEDLLDVANLQRGELPLRLEITDLATLVRESVERRAALADDAQHQITVNMSVASWPIRIDRDRIQQLIDNLLDNAIKYSPAGGTIEVILGESQGGVQLSVRDQGIGLPSGAEEMIFDPLKRAPNATARNIPGLGLGLYICRRLAEQHRGRLWATSAGENMGTTLCLWLPGHTTDGSTQPAHA